MKLSFGKIFYGWWIVFACFVLSLYTSGTIFYGFTALFKPLVKEFAWSYTLVSFGASIRGLEMGVLSPFVGLLSDRLGTRRLIFWGAFTLGVGLICLSLTQSLWMFYCSFFVIALGASGCTTLVSMAAVANWFDKKVGLALGVMMAGHGFGGLFVPCIVSLVDTYGWRITLVIMGLGTWTLAMPIGIIVRNTPEEYGYLPDGVPSAGGSESTLIKLDANSISLRNAFRTKLFRYVCVAELIRHLVLTALITHVMPYLTNEGIPRMTAGFVAALIPLLSVVGRFCFGWLSDIFRKKYVMATTFFLMSLGMLAFYYVENRYMILVFLFLYSPGFGGSMVLRGAIIRDSFGRDSFGKLIGIMMGFGAIGGLIGPTMAGWVFDTFESYSFVWLFFSGLICVATVLILKLNEDLS